MAHLLNNRNEAYYGHMYEERHRNQAKLEKIDYSNHCIEKRIIASKGDILVSLNGL